MAERILVVDDEPDLLELVRINLDQAGFDVSTAADGSSAIRALQARKPDLLVLDLMLPDMSGTDICRKVRSDPELADVPVIMLTARADEVDRVVGFELGADDYVTKPFSPRELVLRVRAVLRRRSGGPEVAGSLKHGALRVEPERHRCFVEDEEIELTAKEFDLLQALMRNQGRVLTRDQLLDRVWGEDIAVTTRTIDTHLKRLREKLRTAGPMIETVRGVGYRFTD